MTDKNTPIAQCRNLGPASAKVLAGIGIQTFNDLAQKGAVEAFVSLAITKNKTPNLNLLYAMLGAVDNRHWTEYKSKKVSYFC